MFNFTPPHKGNIVNGKDAIYSAIKAYIQDLNH